MVNDLPCKQVLPSLPLIALETVTMVRYDLSKVVTDQKQDEQFFHEGSHV
jgi:hypothetical protein